MKLSVTQENLAKGLGMAARAVATRSTMPILGNILLATDEGGRLRLSATNLELGITCWIAAKVEEAGATTIPAKTLVDLVNTLCGDRVSLTLQAATQTLGLTCAKVRANLKGIPAAEFPVIPAADLAASIEFPADSFKEMLGHVLFAAATDEARPVLTAVRVALKDNAAILVASDGFRLALRIAGLFKPVAQPVEALIPARALAELARLLTGDEPVLMCLPPGRGQVIFHQGSLELVAQLLEGAFPEFQNIIPRQRTTRAVVSIAEFRKACKSADIFAREAAHTARFKVGDNNLTISASSAETGDNVAEIPAMVDGAPVEIAFNVKYATDALNAMPGEQVALDLNTSTSPGVLRPVGRGDYLVVVMPMHLGGNGHDTAAAPAAEPAAVPAQAAAAAAQTVPATTAA